MIKHIFKLIWNKRKNNTLIIVELFLSFLILFAVLTFMYNSVDKLFTPLGFETKDHWIINQSYTNDSTTLADNNISLKTSLNELSEVEEVAFGNSARPFSGYTWQTSIDYKGMEIQYKLLECDENFVKTMGLKIIEGRWFNETDAEYTYKPIVITRDFRDNYFQGKSLIDSILPLGEENAEGVAEEYKIIGVSEEYKYEGEFAKSYPKIFFYLPKTNQKAKTIYLAMKENTPATYEEQVNDVLTSITKSNSGIILNLENLRKSDSREKWIPIIALLIICGFLCLNIALGLYGVLWYSISQRRGEIGLRSALGADKGSITKQFVLEILFVSLIGIMAGVFFAVQFPILKVFPVESKFYYYAIFTAISFLLGLVTLCAIYPSMQAARINPADALHED